MHITLLTVGKTDIPWVRAGLETYVSRLEHYVPFSLKEIPELKGVSALGREQIKAREGELILSHIRPGETVWAMDLGGENVTSEKLSDYLVSDIEKSGGSLKIVIGGSNGISPEVRARANRRLCFGNITLTHLMTRLVLAEQLYRGFKIAKGEKYHK